MAGACFVFLPKAPNKMLLGDLCMCAGQADPGPPERTDTSRKRTYKTKQETDKTRNVTGTIVLTLLGISVVVPMLQYWGAPLPVCRALLASVPWLLAGAVRCRVHKTCADPADGVTARCGRIHRQGLGAPRAVLACGQITCGGAAAEGFCGPGVACGRRLGVCNLACSCVTRRRFPAKCIFGGGQRELLYRDL